MRVCLPHLPRTTQQIPPLQIVPIIPPVKARPPSASAQFSEDGPQWGKPFEGGELPCDEIWPTFQNCVGIRATLRFTWYLNRISRSSTKNIAEDFDVRLDSKTPRWVFLYPIFSISVECLAGCYRCRKEGEQTYICFWTDSSTTLRFGHSFTFLELARGLKQTLI